MARLTGERAWSCGVVGFMARGVGAVEGRRERGRERERAHAPLVVIAAAQLRGRLRAGQADEPQRTTELSRPAKTAWQQSLSTSTRRRAPSCTHPPGLAPNERERERERETAQIYSTEGTPSSTITLARPTAACPPLRERALDPSQRES